MQSICKEIKIKTPEEVKVALIKAGSDFINNGGALIYDDNGQGNYACIISAYMIQNKIPVRNFVPTHLETPFENMYQIIRGFD